MIYKWPEKADIKGVNEEAFKAITTSVDVAATIQIIWSKQIEKNYLANVFMEQFAVVNTELVGVKADTVKISKINFIGPAVDMITGGKGWVNENLNSPEAQWVSATDIRETALTSFELVEFKPTKKFKAVLFTKEEMENAFAPRMQDATEALSFAFKLKMDMDCHASLGVSTNIVGHATWATLTAGASDGITGLMVKAAKLRYDLQVKRQAFAYYDGGTVVALISPYQYYELTEDPDIFDVVKRNKPDVLFRNEQFTWSDVRFVIDEGVPFYAGGTLTEITSWQNMRPYDNTTYPNDTWLFSTDGTWANVKDCIAPYYQCVAVTKQRIALNLDAVDTARAAQVVMIDHHNGIVKFDILVGDTGSGVAVPQAKFSYGTVYGYQAQIIGPRAFAIAKKYDPQLVQEMRNFNNFVAIGGFASWQVKQLNPEQVVLLQTNVVPPFKLNPAL
jgi:N4-gp56 family major capsid protein